MKKLFMLAMMLVMTCTIAFAASDSPYDKGVGIGKELVKGIMQDNEKVTDTVIENLVNSIVELTYLDSDNLEPFLNGVKKGMKEKLKEYDISEVYAEEAFNEIITPILTELGIES